MDAYSRAIPLGGPLIILAKIYLLQMPFLELYNVYIYDLTYLIWLKKPTYSLRYGLSLLHRVD